jgi:hypothetical protein
MSNLNKVCKAVSEKKAADRTTDGWMDGRATDRPGDDTMNPWFIKKDNAAQLRGLACRGESAQDQPGKGVSWEAVGVMAPGRRGTYK